MTTIRHVRYDDFYALYSEGAGDLDGLRTALDRLQQRMGDPRDHPILFDLRAATLPPLHRITTVEAAAELHRRGIGVDNRLAVVIDPADAARALLLREVEAVAAHMGMQVRGFSDYAAALEYLAGRGDAG